MTILRRPSLFDAALWGIAAALAAVAVKRVFRQSLELLAGTSYAAAFDLRLRYVTVAGVLVWAQAHTVGSQAGPVEPRPQPRAVAFRQDRESGPALHEPYLQGAAR